MSDVRDRHELIADLVEVRKEIFDLQAENERLRSALTRITDPALLPVRGVGVGRALELIHAMRKIASEALQ